MHRPFVLTVLALALPAAAQCPTPAYAIDSNLDQLFSIDLTTGAATLIGSTLSGGVLATPAGLTWRPDTRTMWTIDLAGGEVGTIDLNTGNFTTVFNSGLSGWQGIDFDPVTGLFFLLNQTNNIYTLDPATGVTTLVGLTGVALTTALETDAAGTLWAAGLSNGVLYQINKTTGAATATVTSTPAGLQGLSFDAAGILYGANTNTDSLYRIDPLTGATTLVGAHGAGIQFVKGFEIINSGTPACVRLAGTGCGGLTQNAWRPVIGTTINLNVGGIQLTSLAGIDLLGSVLPNPIDLTGAGLPGCSLYVSPIFFALPFPTTATTAAVPVAIPNDPSLIGGQIGVQAVTVTPGANPFGALLSNLAVLVFGDV